MSSATNSNFDRFNMIKTKKKDELEIINLTKTKFLKQIHMNKFLRYAHIKISWSQSFSAHRCM